MCTETEAAGAMSPNEQLSVFAAIEQFGLSGLSDQLIPAPVGSGSDNVTAFAVPVPLFVTVIVKPSWSPALTVAASAVLVIARFGQFTVVDALACTDDWFVALAVAVFGYALQLAEVVPLTT
jgi:hypothetical protein